MDTLNDTIVSKYINDEEMREYYRKAMTSKSNKTKHKYEQLFDERLYELFFPFYDELDDDQKTYFNSKECKRERVKKIKYKFNSILYTPTGTSGSNS